MIATLHSNGVSIQVPEVPASGYNIQISGNNNVVVLPPIPQIALPKTSEPADKLSEKRGSSEGEDTEHVEA